MPSDVSYDDLVSILGKKTAQLEVAEFENLQFRKAMHEAADKIEDLEDQVETLERENHLLRMAPRIIIRREGEPAPEGATLVPLGSTPGGGDVMEMIH